MKYPYSPRHIVKDCYHGIEVNDPYRWLEDSENAEVRAWSTAQVDLTRQYLDAVPQRADFYDRLSQIYKSSSAEYYRLQSRPQHLFALKHQPPLQQPLLVMLNSADALASERIVLDPNQLDPSGGTAIDFYSASLDGSLVAVSLSTGGSERGDVHIYDTRTGAALPDVIRFVQIPTGGGSVAWNAAGDGLYYTRYPRPGERPDGELDFYQQIYYHPLGQPASQDAYVIGADFPAIAECQLAVTPDGQYLLLLVHNGDGGEVAHYLRDPLGNWTQLTHFTDQIQDASLGPDQNLYLLSRQDAPRGKILRVPLSTPRLSAAQVIVPHGELAIRGFLPTQNLLYITEMDGGPSRLRAVDHTGRPAFEVPAEPVSAVYTMVREQGDTILFMSGSYVSPFGWSRFDPAIGLAQKTALVSSSPVNFDDCEVVREFATSRDGTRVPLNILRRKNLVLDGSSPALLTGYGGYGIGLVPFFDARLRLWMDMGGVFAVANLRGGGEYGEAWHKAGNLVNKQNVFDDFIACALHLIQRGYTSPRRLCIEGGSNGGLLMGAAFTQRPDLFCAVAAHVGIYDMLRVETDSNGAFNVTEFGTVNNPQHFEALYDYSPYHRVCQGTYPAILFTTGEHDGRVLPYHSRKMAALMQSTGSPNPVLLRINSAGHGIGTALEEQIAQDADVFAFFASQLNHAEHK
jgi:prolyl oligopeptidase